MVAINAAEYGRRLPDDTDRALHWPGVVALFICLYGIHCHAAVLPEERADSMYHFYDGGGVRVTGPALLVRKNVTDTAFDYYCYEVSERNSVKCECCVE